MLTKEQNQIFRAWFKERGITGICPACGKNAGWDLHDEILSGFVMDVDKKDIRQQSLTGFVPLACKNCLFTMFFPVAPILGRTPNPATKYPPKS